MPDLQGDVTTDPDLQEALSRRYSPDVVTLLQLRSGRFAVYNSIREFCGVLEPNQISPDLWPPAIWHPAPAPPGPTAQTIIDLADLGLL